MYGRVFRSTIFQTWARPISLTIIFLHLETALAIVHLGTILDRMNRINKIIMKNNKNNFVITQCF
jgi:hypothetical protein